MILKQFINEKNIIFEKIYLQTAKVVRRHRRKENPEFTKWIHSKQMRYTYFVSPHIISSACLEETMKRCNFKVKL